MYLKFIIDEIVVIENVDNVCILDKINNIIDKNKNENIKISLVVYTGGYLSFYI